MLDEFVMILLSTSKTRTSQRLMVGPYPYTRRVYPTGKVCWLIWYDAGELAPIVLVKVDKHIAKQKCNIPSEAELEKEYQKFPKKYKLPLA